MDDPTRETTTNAPPAPRYWAFISYSHRDEAWARWLHRALETWPIPARLRAQTGPWGPWPKRLFPVFRDREELASSADLGAVLNRALHESRYLIVICSPQSAASRWVDEEIRSFRTRHGDARILALIVEGEPHASDPARECLPPALRDAWVGNDGSVQRRERIAADARAGHDGRDGALIKLLAGLLGVGYDDLRQRERQRRLLRWATQGLALAALIAASAGAWTAFERYKSGVALQARIDQLYERARQESLRGHDARSATLLAEVLRLGHDTPALRYLLGRALQVVEAHAPLRLHAGGYVYRPAYSSDGARVVTPAASTEGMVASVWERHTGRMIARLREVPGTPQIVRWLDGDRSLLISGYVETGEVAQRDAAVRSGAHTMIYDSSSGQLLARFDGHAGRIGEPLSADGTLLALAEGHNFRGAELRALPSGKLLHRFDYGVPVTAASLHPDAALLITGDARGEVRLWDADSGRLLRVLPGRAGSRLVATLFTPDGTRVVAVGERGDIRGWSMADGESTLAFAADPSFVNEVHFDETGQRMLTVGSRGVRLWDLARGVLLYAANRNLDRRASAALSPDGETLVLTQNDLGEIEIVHARSRRRIAALELPGAPPAVAIFDRRGTELLVADIDGELNLWRFPLRPDRLLPHPPSVYAVHWAGKDGQLASGGYDGRIRHWSPQTPEPIADFAAHAGDVRVLRWRADGETGYSAGGDGRLQAWQRGRDAPLYSVDAHAGGIAWLALSPDGSALATAGDPEQSPAQPLRLWSAADGRLLHALDADCAPVDPRFNADGERIAAGCGDGSLRVWRVADGQQLLRLPTASEPLQAVAWSADGKLLASIASGEARVTIHDAVSGTVVTERTLDPGAVPTALAFAPDGRQLAVGTQAGRIVIVSLSDTAAVDIESHQGLIMDLRYLGPQLLLSWGYDATLRVTDTARGQSLGVLGQHDIGLWALDIDAAGAQVATAGLDGYAGVWTLPAWSGAADELEQRLRCRVRWRVDGTALVPVGSC